MPDPIVGLTVAENLPFNLCLTYRLPVGRVLQARSVCMKGPRQCWMVVVTFIRP